MGCKHDELRHAGRRHSRRIKKIIDLLHQIEGKFERILLTDNSPLIELGLSFAVPEIAICFEHQMFSYKLGGPKRKPATLLRALDTFGVEPTFSMLIDDNSAVLETAKMLGIRTLPYKNDDDLAAIAQALGVAAQTT